MDANELFARTEMIQRQREASPAGGADPDTQKFVAELDAQTRREQQNLVMQCDEICKKLRLPDIDALAAQEPLLRGLGFPVLPRKVDLDRFGNPTPTTRIMRHDYDQWREKFDALAVQLGYLAPGEVQPSLRARAAAVVGLTLLLALLR